MRDRGICFQKGTNPLKDSLEIQYDYCICMGGMIGVRLPMEKLLFTALITFSLHNRASLLAFRSALGCFESFLVNIVMEFNDVLLYLHFLFSLELKLFCGKGRIPLVSSICCFQHLNHNYQSVFAVGFPP